MVFVALKVARKALPLIAISVEGGFVSGTFLMSYIPQLGLMILRRWLSSVLTVGTGELSGASYDATRIDRQRLKRIDSYDHQRQELKELTWFALQYVTKLPFSVSRCRVSFRLCSARNHPFAQTRCTEAWAGLKNMSFEVSIM